jgi:hypothetical protein
VHVVHRAAAVALCLPFYNGDCTQSLVVCAAKLLVLSEIQRNALKLGDSMHDLMPMNSHSLLVLCIIVE